MSTSKIATRRNKIRLRIRKKIAGTAERPRLSVYRSSKEIYAQLINDDTAVTLAAASSVKIDKAGKTKSDIAKEVGTQLAELAKAAGVVNVVFDRGGFLYHGRVKALADAARENGLSF
jgi:large subunit ribosomal protein L18